jgi:hypothetical protein
MHCLESARLLSERHDHPLPPAQRIGLRLHLLICSVCKTYRKQLDAICSIAHRAGAEPSSHGATLTDGRKKSIQDAIDRSRR